MYVGWELADGESYGFDAWFFAGDTVAETWSGAGADKGSSAEIGKSERRLAVAAPGCAEDGKQCGVLRNREQLTIRKCPSFGRRIAGVEGELTEKSLIAKVGGSRGECACDGNDVVQRERGLCVVEGQPAASGAGGIGRRRQCVVV